MRILLGSEPLLSPFTGIGYYANALATRLHKDPVVSLSLYAFGIFQDTEKLLTTGYENNNSITEPSKSSFLGKVKDVAVKSEMIVSAYGKLLPTWEKWRLAQYKDALFHSTNYTCPNFDGASCVTVHDLSTHYFPEFHPKVRANVVNTEITKVIDKKIPIITDSNFIKQQLTSDFSVDESLVSVIHLGADEAFKPRTEQECKEILLQYKLSYQQYFLTVATIEPRKNILIVLTAYQEYCSRVKDAIPLVLVGSEGWHSEKEHDMIQEMSLKGKLRYLGYVSRKDLHKLYSAANSFIFPSLYEGFGLPVLEAISSGLPVLTSIDSSMSEILQGNGIEVNPNNVESIVDNMSELASDRELRDAIGSACLAASVVFSWEQTYKLHLNLYEKLIHL